MNQAHSRQLTEVRDSLRELRSEEHTSELQSHLNLVCRLLLEKKKKQKQELDDRREQPRQPTDRGAGRAPANRTRTERRAEPARERIEYEGRSNRARRGPGHAQTS